MLNMKMALFLPHNIQILMLFKQHIRKGFIFNIIEKLKKNNHNVCCMYILDKNYYKYFVILRNDAKYK